MRDWSKIDRIYADLSKDIYPQPDEEGRIEVTREIIQQAPIDGFRSVIDLGCGQGYARDLFKDRSYVGITASTEDRSKGSILGRNIFVFDFNFIEILTPRDLLFASHALEHSPFPLITLMLWRELGDNLLLIAPNPDHYGYIGRNHYAVMPKHQLRWLLRRAGWKVTWKLETHTDLAFLCHKEEIAGSEGWAGKLTEEILRSDKENL